MKYLTQPSGYLISFRLFLSKYYNNEYYFNFIFEWILLYNLICVCNFRVIQFRANASWPKCLRNIKSNGKYTSVKLKEGKSTPKPNTKDHKVSQLFIFVSSFYCARSYSNEIGLVELALRIRPLVTTEQDLQQSDLYLDSLEYSIPRMRCCMWRLRPGTTPISHNVGMLRNGVGPFGCPAPSSQCLPVVCPTGN